MWNSADLQSIMLFQFWIKGNWSSHGTMEYYWSAKVLLSRAFNWWDSSELSHPWVGPWHDRNACLVSLLSARSSRGAPCPVSVPFHFFYAVVFTVINFLSLELWQKFWYFKILFTFVLWVHIPSQNDKFVFFYYIFSYFMLSIDLNKQFMGDVVSSARIVG